MLYVKVYFIVALLFFIFLFGTSIPTITRRRGKMLGRLFYVFVLQAFTSLFWLPLSIYETKRYFDEKEC